MNIFTLRHSALLLLLNALKELCFPPVCLICRVRLLDDHKIHLCPDCRAELSLIKPPLCSCCGIEFRDSAGGNHLCAGCLTSPPAFSKARAILRYSDVTVKIVHDFKYRGKTSVRSTLTGLKEQAGPFNDLSEPDLILPVPLHPMRLRERGFNQALLLAGFFYSERKDHIKPSLLIRKRQTQHQTGLKGRERRRNLFGAFEVSNSREIIGQKILLIDDVFTTGSTVNECAKVLMASGAQEVQVLTLARVAGYK